MTVLIFRQGGNNERIGNTFVWLEKARNWCELNGLGFCFVPGIKTFREVFSIPEDFFIPRVFLDADIPRFFNDENLHKDMFGRISSTIKNSNEFKSGKLYEILPTSLGFIKMEGISWDENEQLIRDFKKFEYVIVDEPFPFKLNAPIEISTLLKPNEQVSSELRHHRQEMFTTVHVRQGDYARWQNGKNYKDNTFYNKLIRELVNLDLGKIAVAHNGEFELESDLVEKIHNVDFESEFSPHIKDILTLSCSQNIIGPYSTFSVFSSNLCKREDIESPNLILFKGSDSVEEILSKLRKENKS